MAKSKRIFWQVLEMVEQLSDEQRLDLLEKLTETDEGKQKKERKPRKPRESGMGQAVKESIESVTCAIPNCGLIQEAAVHDVAHPEFHKFRTSIKRKAAGAEG